MLTTTTDFILLLSSTLWLFVIAVPIPLTGQLRLFLGRTGSSIVLYYLVDFHRLCRYWIVSTASPNVSGIWTDVSVILMRAVNATFWTFVIGSLRLR